jgi:N-acetylglutamate synthase-like GNAT family acetyltransferase
MSLSQSDHNLSFRKASIQDAEAISELVNSAYRGDSSRQGWTTEAEFLSGQRTDPLAIEDILLSPHQWILVCEQKGELIGSVQLEKVKPDTCYFGMFAIQPLLQAKGVGKLFLEAAEKFAHEELNCQWMEMTVITLRTELIAWYERRGYQRTDELRNFPYGDERFGIPLRPDIALLVFKKRL